MLWIDYKPVKLKYFPDGTMNLNKSCEVFNEWMVYGAPDSAIISWQFAEEAECMALFHLVEHLHNAFLIKEIVLEMPYLPNARMDRVHEDDEVFTLRSFAKFINMMNFEAVVCWDVHSNVGAALLDRFVPVNIGAFHKVVLDYYKPDVVCYPDAGAMKRYNKDIDKPYVYGEKVRDWETGVIMGMTIHNPARVDLVEKKILIIDDICSRGGTFLGAGQKLQDLGAKEVALCVTHLENTVFAGQLLKDDSPIAKIYTTNSLPHAEHEKIETLDCFQSEV